MAKGEVTDVRALQKLGELCQKKEDRHQAARHFAKAAETYGSRGLFSKAVALYKRVLALDPSLIEVNLKLAEYYEQLQLAGEAILWFQKAADEYEKAGDTEASRRALTQGDTLKKRVELERSRDQRPLEELRTARELAEAHLSRGELKAALEHLQIALNTHPRDVDTLRLLARAFRALGQDAKAAEIDERVARVLKETGRRVVRKAVAPLESREPTRASPAEVSLFRINLVPGVKASKANPFTAVAPQRWAYGSAAVSDALATLLTQQGLIGPLSLQRARDERAPGEALQSSLIRVGAIEESLMVDVLSRHYQTPGIFLEHFDLEAAVLALIPDHLWITYCVLPVNLFNSSLIVAMRDPSDLEVVDALRFLTGLNIEPVVSTELSLRRAIDRYTRAAPALLS